MLSALRPDALARIRFPLGALTKPEVRDIARAAELPVAERRESQDLCFLAGTSRERFLARHGGRRERPGDLVDAGGRVLGHHRGHRRYTVGQRRGLGVATGEPLFVLAKDAASNRVLVGPREALAADTVVLRDVTLNRDGQRVNSVKLRYRSEPLACHVAAAPGHHDTLTATLAEQALGVAPGQTACLMDGDLVVGHGTIAASA
jgi:tRNA-specific 2-thiouridylase